MKGRKALMSSARTGESERDEWRTPPHVIAAIADAFGRIDFDMFATDDNAVAKIAVPDALAEPMPKTPAVVFANPPYSKMRDAAKRIDQASANVLSVVSLVPARTDTQWWQDITQHCNYVVLLKGRLKFLTPSQLEITSAPFPSAIVLHGASCAQAVRLAEALGGVVWKRDAVREQSQVRTGPKHSRTMRAA